MFISIRVKTLVFQIGLILMVASAIGLSSYFFMVDSLRQNQERSLEYIAQSQARQVSSSVESTAGELEGIAQGEPIKIYFEHYKELLEGYLARYKQTFPILALVNESGREEVKLVYGEKSDELSDLSQTPCFQEAIRNPNKIFISPFVQVLSTPTNSHALFMEFSFCLQNPSGKFICLTIGRVPLDYIVRGIQEFRFGRSGFLMLMDAKGTVLSHPQKDKVLRRMTGRGDKGQEIIRRARAMESGFGHAMLSDVDGYLSYAPVIGRDWSVIAIMPYREFMVSPNALKDTIISIFCTILLLAVLLSLGISNRIITAPLVRLSAITEAIAHGDLSQRIEIKSKDEIGTLSESFNRMTEDLQKSRDELLAAKEYTDSILKSLTDALLVLDQDMKIKMVNRAACELTGYREEDLIGQPFTAILAERFSDKSIDFERLIEKGTFMNYETAYRTRDKDPVPMLFSGAVIRDKSGDTERVVIIAKDITARKAAEEKLKHAAVQLKERNEELTALIYTFQHHLREPLVNVKGFSGELRYHLKRIDFILDRYVSRMGKKDQEMLPLILDENIPEAIGFIDSSVNRMDSMINAILHLLNLENQKLTTELVDLGALTRSVLEDIHDRVEECGIKVILGALPEVIADKAALKQVISTILDNAVKYLQPGRSGEIQINAERDSGETIFHVRDNGRGIAREDMHKVFGFFRRAGKQDVPGEGMGMAYARVLLRRHGGRIWYKSEVGAGTTFSFTIPNRPDIRNQQESQESTEGAMTGLLV
ncbi:MAG: ATP-binding protein [bacterium]